MSARLTPSQVVRQATAGTLHRNRLLINALDTIVLLSRRRWRAVELAAQLGIGKRALYRVLNSIEAVGLVLHSQPDGRNTVYWLQRGDVVRTLGIASFHALPQPCTKCGHVEKEEV